MSDIKDQIDAVAALMDEFKLSEATWSDAGRRVTFRRKSARLAPVAQIASVATEAAPEVEELEPAAPVQAGTPITSPMNGIFYATASPGTPPFAKEGDTIQAGQPIGLIEAMKVFNEVPSPLSGTVLKVVAESGAVVMPGDVLMYVG